MPIRIDTIVPEILMLVEGARQQDEKQPGISTGYRSIDRTLGGFQRKELTILATQSSTGKTSLLLEIARRVSLESEKSVLFLSAKDSLDEIGHSLISLQTGIDFHRLRRGQISEQQSRRFSTAAEELSKSRIYWCQISGGDLYDVWTEIRETKHIHKIGIAFIDDLDLLTGPNPDIVQHLRTLQRLAEIVEIPIVVSTSLTLDIAYYPN